ncbi:MAG TPA: hypothetical protein VFT60_12010 [Bryobacteraceae bacterium]|nr:hypothetical protein [Bryobacteraceae bacterium]
MNHLVVSLVNDEPAKVRCRTCHNDHDFRHEQAPPPRVDSRKASAIQQAMENAAAATGNGAGAPEPPKTAVAAENGAGGPNPPKKAAEPPAEEAPAVAMPAPAPAAKPARKTAKAK